MSGGNNEDVSGLPSSTFPSTNSRLKIRVGGKLFWYCGGTVLRAFQRMLHAVHVQAD